MKVVKELAVTKLFKELYYISIPTEELDWPPIGIVEAEDKHGIGTYFVFMRLNDYYYIFMQAGIVKDWNFKNRVVKIEFDSEEPKMKIHSSVTYTDYLKDKLNKTAEFDINEQLPSIPKSTEIEFECKIIVNKTGLHKLKPITAEVDVGWKVGEEIEVWFFKDGKLIEGLKRRVNKLFNRGEAVALQFTRRQAEQFGLAGKKKVKCFKNIPKTGAVTIVVD